MCIYIYIYIYVLYMYMYVYVGVYIYIYIYIYILSGPLDRGRAAGKLREDSVPQRRR